MLSQSLEPIEFKDTWAGSNTHILLQLRYMKEYTHLHVHGHITMFNKPFINDVTHVRSIQGFFFLNFFCILLQAMEH